jgi:hypothetical protein
MKYLKLFESYKKIGISKLIEISKIIEQQYPSINSGGCAVFARAFHNITGYPYILIIDTDLLEEDPPIHIMIELPDGRLYDAEGIRTSEEVEQYYEGDETGELMFLKDIDGTIVDNYYEDLGSGLFTTCHKDDYDNIYKTITDLIS